MKRGFLCRITKSFFLCVLVICMILMTACDNLENDDSKKSYDVSDVYFSFSEFKCLTLSSIGVNGNSGSGTSYELNVKGMCTVSLYEYTISVKAYSAQGSLLLDETETSEKEIDANKEFSHSFDITSTQKQQITRVEVKYSGKSYDDPTSGEKATKKVSVTFMNGGTQVSKVSVAIGETVSAPKNPTQTNYIFDAWYTDQACTKEYDFSKKVTTDITLYAGFLIDAVTLTNKITQSTIHGVVTVYNKMYNTQKILGIDTGKITESYTSQGSGFIFRVQGNYCFVITNCHVAKKRGGYEHQTYTIEDYQGNTYEAVLYSNPDTGHSKAIAAEYDLAFLQFKSPSANLVALPLATENPDVGEDIISLGSPKNQTNAIKYGSVEQYRKMTLNNTSTSLSNVTFNVLAHDAPTAGGSSGGPVLNANLQVVGVNYAGNDSIGGAIPIKKVRDFLNEYVYD